MRLGKLQESGFPFSREAEEDSRPAARVDEFPVFARLLWVCAALYGKSFNYVIGTYRHVSEPSEADFFRYVVQRMGFVFEYHRDENNCDFARGGSVAEPYRGGSATPHQATSAASPMIEGSSRPPNSPSSEDQPSRVYYPAHAILVDHTDKKIIVAVRGTVSLRDALTDLVCIPYLVDPVEKADLGFARNDAPEGHLRVHRGMWKAAKRLSEELRYF